MKIWRYPEKKRELTPEERRIIELTKEAAILSRDLENMIREMNQHISEGEWTPAWRVANELMRKIKDMESKLWRISKYELPPKF